jgi:hypothetical protein
MDDINEARRKAIAETIHTISQEELKTLGEGLFPYMDHPWRDTYFNFIAENAASTFHHATTDDGVHIIYCGSKGKGMWFVPGSGMGPLQARGLGILKDIVARL